MNSQKRNLLITCNCSSYKVYITTYTFNLAEENDNNYQTMLVGVFFIKNLLRRLSLTILKVEARILKY